MRTLIHERVEGCRNGTNAKCIARVASGWVVLGDVQFQRGYSLLLPDPVVPDLNALQGSERTAFLTDMASLGDVLLEVTGAWRINYEILGNGEPALHAHLFPRYADEPAEERRRPVWHRFDPSDTPFDPARDAPLMARIREGLDARDACVTPP